MIGCFITSPIGVAKQRRHGIGQFQLASKKVKPKKKGVAVGNLETILVIRNGKKREANTELATTARHSNPGEPKSFLTFFSLELH